MKIQYWGTAAAEGVPGIFCDCETCRLARQYKGRKIRMRSQVLVNDDLLIDFGPDTYYNSLRFDYNMTYLKDIIITHPHEDHLYSEEFEHRLPGFSPVINNPVLTVHASEDTFEAIRRVTDRIPYFKGQDRIAFDPFTPYVTKKVGRYNITALPAEHGTATPFVYLVEEGEKSFLLLNDTGIPSDGVYQYLIGRGIVLDVISFDTTYGFEDVVAKYGKADHHMGLLDNVVVRDFLKANGVADEHTVCIATHYSHNGIDVDYDKMCKHTDDYGFINAYDGMELEF